MHGQILVERYVAADRHSRLVRRLRWLLPALVGVAIVVFILLGLAKSFIGNVSLLSIKFDGSTLVMDHPNLKGYDSNRRPYALTAERASQDVSTPNKIRLEKLDARIELAGANEARIIADKGFYDGDANQFLAEGHVHIITTLGYELFMNTTIVHLKASIMESQDPVEVRNGDNRIFADRMKVSEGGSHIIFDGRVKTIFVPPESK